MQITKKIEPVNVMACSNNIWWAVLGKRRAGKIWIKPIDQMQPLDERPQHMPPCQGLPHACTARPTLTLE